MEILIILMFTKIVSLGEALWTQKVNNFNRSSKIYNIGLNFLDIIGEKIAVRTLHRIFNQNNVPVGLVEKSLVKIDPKQSKEVTTSSRMGRSPVTADRAIEVDDHDLEIVEVVANALVNMLNGKDIKKLLYK